MVKLFATVGGSGLGKYIFFVFSRTRRQSYVLKEMSLCYNFRILKVALVPCVGEGSAF